MTGRGTSAPITAWSNCSIESLTSTGTAPGSQPPTCPSRPPANQVASMLCAAGKSSSVGIVAVIDPSTKGYAELRERGHEGRMRQRLQAAAFARVRAPCDRLVPADGAKARTLAASHQARHRLERIAAGDLRHVRAARRVLSTHRQQNAAIGANSRGVEANDRGAGRGEVGTCDEEIDAASDAVRLQRCDLGNDAPNLALALRKVNRDMHLVGRGGGKCRDRVVVSQRQATGCERSEQNALEIAKDVRDARVFKRLAAAKRDRARPVLRKVATERRLLLRPELDASLGVTSAVAKPARLFAALRQLDRHTLDVHSSDHAVTISHEAFFMTRPL